MTRTLNSNKKRDKALFQNSNLEKNTGIKNASAISAQGHAKDFPRMPAEEGLVALLIHAMRKRPQANSYWRGPSPLAE